MTSIDELIIRWFNTDFGMNFSDGMVGNLLLIFLCLLATVLFSGVIGFPGELVPLSLVKMFSSSAATGLLLDVYKKYGTDSFLGLAASISMCCTETIFYTMSVYFMTAKINRTRYTLAGALIATFAGLAASVFLAGML